MGMTNQKHFTPVLAQVTVKAIIINTYGRILLLQRRSDDIGGGKWDLPGGMLEKGEMPTEGLTREVTEETGLPIIDWRPVHTHGSMPRKVKNYTVVIWFASQGDFSDITLDEENSARQWILPEDALRIPEELFPLVHKEAIIRALQ